MRALTIAFMCGGAAFMLLAAVGVLRLPDTFTRMQAATKAVTLGVSLMMLAVATHFADASISVRTLATVLFLFATAPVGAHVIGRVAYHVGAELWQGTVVDELRTSYATRREECPPPADDRAAEPPPDPSGPQRQRS